MPACANFCSVSTTTWDQLGAHRTVCLGQPKLAFTPRSSRPPLLFWGVVLAPLALVFLLSFRIEKMSLGAAQAAFWSYAGLVGFVARRNFLVYTGMSIARTFFIAAATFLVMSLYGYTAKPIFPFRFIPVDGAFRRHHRQFVNVFSCFIGFAARDLGDRRRRLRRAHCL